MELALIRELIAAFPDIDDKSMTRLDEILALCDRFFLWEREAILLGEPSGAQKKEHEELVQFLQRLTKVLLRVERNKKLEALARRLNESWLIFHNPISKEEAQSTLGGGAVSPGGDVGGRGLGLGLSGGVSTRNYALLHAEDVECCK